MTLPRLYAFSKSWLDTPALQDSIAAIAVGLGAIKPKRTAPAENSPEAQEELGKLLESVPMQFRRMPA